MRRRMDQNEACSFGRGHLATCVSVRRSAFARQDIFAADCFYWDKLARSLRQAPTSDSC